MATIDHTQPSIIHFLLNAFIGDLKLRDEGLTLAADLWIIREEVVMVFEDKLNLALKD